MRPPSTRGAVVTWTIVGLHLGVRGEGSPLTWETWKNWVFIRNLFEL